MLFKLGSFLLTRNYFCAVISLDFNFKIYPNSSGSTNISNLKTVKIGGKNGHKTTAC